ncbi:membrane-spanning 4-domains subfamily A member 6B-like [Rattus norvegicus]|uniref:membrane-spanning 4-domains subfamily A member 6B-like n=1 Tax=Rattus norvegicus TaxID=10116 RepID=UPI002FD85CA0
MVIHLMELSGVNGKEVIFAAIQIMCSVMVLALGIILASVPSIPHFTSVFSVLLKSGYPFVGALFVPLIIYTSVSSRQ